MKNKHMFLAFGLVVFGVLGIVSNTSAEHSWGTYHWARTANPFTLKLGDNVTSAWDSYLATTSSDWSVSSVLDTSVVTGVTNPKNCKAVPGRVEVCNSKYGNNGWLGIAQIWITSGSHITQGAVKMNDTYFNTRTYNKPAWRNLVMCQEVGHTLGLDHQDEDFDNANLGTCMDYTSDPTSNQHPNAHDYAELEDIYAHLDTSTTLSQVALSKNMGAEVGAFHSEWGKAIRQDAQGRDNVFARDLGNGNVLLTHVFWAE